MKRTLGYLLSLALVGTAAAQTSSGSGSQTGSGSQADQGSKAAPQGRSAPEARGRSKAKSGEHKFHSRLKSSNDVNASAAGSAAPSGTADFTTDGAIIVYEVHVSDMATPPAAAEIHMGAPGDAGPVIVVLPLTPNATGAAEGKGTIDASQIRGTKPDGSPMAMDDLVIAMRSGKAHVAVRSKRNDPAGLSGPIESEGP
jgi:hypothetical protein